MTPTEMYAQLTTGDRQGPAFEALLAEWNALPYATQSKVIAAKVEAWVNPSAWDDPAEAAAVVEAILASGTTDEEAWVRIAGGAVADQRAAGERARDSIAGALDEHVARVDAARAGLAEALRERDDAIRAVIAGGASAYRVAQVTGLSQGLIGRIRHAR